MDTDSEWDTPTEIVSPSSSRNHVPNMKPLESPSRGKDKRRRLKRPDAGKWFVYGRIHGKPWFNSVGY